MEIVRAAGCCVVLDEPLMSHIVLIGGLCRLLRYVLLVRTIEQSRRVHRGNIRLDAAFAGPAPQGGAIGLSKPRLLMVAQSVDFSLVSTSS